MPSPRGSTRRPAKAAAPPATPPYASPALEVLETLEIENALTSIEARLDSLEIDLARATGSREDDARRIAGEMAVMRARVEDALIAFAGTADQIRQTVSSVEKRLSDLVVGEELDASVEEPQYSSTQLVGGCGEAFDAFAAASYCDGQRACAPGQRRSARRKLARVVDYLMAPQRLDDVDALDQGGERSTG